MLFKAFRADGAGGHVLPIEDMDVRNNEEIRGKPAEDLILIPLILGDPEKVTYIGESLQEPLKVRLIKFLQENHNVFA